jgi:hypothetical protein
MNDQEADRVMKLMLAHIKMRGEEKALIIKRSGDEEHKTTKDKYMLEEKEKLTAEYKNKLAQDEIRLRI